MGFCLRVLLSWGWSSIQARRTSPMMKLMSATIEPAEFTADVVGFARNVDVTGGTSFSLF